MKIHAYVRVSSDKQETENQRGEIRRYIEEKKLAHVDEWHDIQISSKRDIVDRKINILIDSIQKGDLLICTELSRLGRSLSQLTNIVDLIVSRGGRIVFIKNNMDIDPLNRDDVQNKVMLTMFGLFAELERDFISRRIKETIRTKQENAKNGGAPFSIGRKKGAIVASKYDAHAGEIINLLNEHGAKWSKLLTIMQATSKALGGSFNGTRQSLAEWVNKHCEKGLGDLWAMK